MGPIANQMDRCSGGRWPGSRYFGRCSGTGKAMAAILLTVFFLMGGAVTAPGKTMRVNSIFDVNDLSPGNDLCVAYIIVSPPFVLPFCTFRAAIEESNALPGDDVIELPSSTVALTIEGRGEEQAGSGDLDITETLTIKGKGPDKTIVDGRGIDRIFDIVATNVTLILRDMTLMNGAAANGGGAVYNRGRLILDNVVMTGNRGLNSRGGGIHNQGYCSIARTLLKNNTAGEGGALYNDENGRLNFSSSTLSENDALSGAGIGNRGVATIVNATISGNGSGATLSGGGIFNRGSLQLTHATVHDNSARAGGGIHNSGAVSLRNSIIAVNIGGDCFRLTSSDEVSHILDSDASCRAGGSNNGITAADPGLRRLGNFGGATPTHALLPLSPARDSGMLFGTSPVDQRGFPRPRGKAVDRGAVEAELFTPLPMIYPLLR